MRNALFATLFLAPTLLHAQAPPPAQPAPTLQSTLVASASIIPANPSNKSTSTTTRPKSTGITPPVLLHSIPFGMAPGQTPQITASAKTVVVGMIVDEAGIPTNLTIQQSAGNLIDSRILATVAQFRYQPGTLDGEPYQIPIRLEIILKRGAAY